MAHLPLNGRAVDGEQPEGGLIAFDDGQVAVKDKNRIGDGVKGVAPFIKRALQDKTGGLLRTGCGADGSGKGYLRCLGLMAAETRANSDKEKNDGN